MRCYYGRDLLLYCAYHLRSCSSAPNICSSKPRQDLPETFLERSGAQHTLLMPHMGSLLADQQNKHSGSYQQSKQNTGDERNNPMPIHGRLRPSAFLRCSETQPEEKFVHSGQPPSSALLCGGHT